MNTPPAGLRERKKQRTREQLAQSAVDLVAARGLHAVRVEDICERVDIGRSTFFRYFETKERAFVEGVHRGRLDAVLDALAARPADESPLAALRGACLDVVADWRIHRDNLLLEARIRRDSAAVQAWASAGQGAWEDAIAAAITPRFAPARRNDLRPRLVASMGMTALRLASERWIADGARRAPAAHVRAAFDALDDVR
jgi:AcrR family transcriptional regulator